MFLKGVEEFLIGKELGSYEIELSPEKAFGNRNPHLINTIPMKVFREQKLDPFPGAVFHFDNSVGKVLTVSGGRVMVDFNHPLAGKAVIYKIKILRKVTDMNEQIKAFNEFLFKRDLKFELKNKTLILEVEKPIAKFVALFSDKFKEIFDLELEVKEIEEKQEKENK
jgi:FKBP-type peptidyl-prolyl cis-trans isomerase 2